MGNALLQYATVLILTIFVGTEIIAKVPSILHTPLVSGSNAIHGVILVGSMLILGSATTNLEMVLGFLAVILGTLNVVGGFVVTDRMLEMFKSKPGERTAARGSGAQAAKAEDTTAQDAAPAAPPESSEPSGGAA